MTFMILTVGTVLYLVVGWMVDQVFPGAALLGLNFQGLVFSTLCLGATVWAAAKLDLFR